jgi:arylmalonate decarboxylase
MTDPANDVWGERGESSVYGWRARIGLLIPSNNAVIEPEFARMAPDGVAVYGARVLCGVEPPERLDQKLREAETQAARLADTKVDVLAYACLATSFFRPEEWSDGFCRTIEAATGIPCVTAESAFMEALTAVGAKRLAIATPQTAARNGHVERIFGRAGFEVRGIKSLEIPDLTEVNRPGPAVAYQLGRAADLPEADALCILATDFRTIEAIEPLERDLAKPVVTNNQALLWACLRRSGISMAAIGYGRLLGTGSAK